MVNGVMLADIRSQPDVLAEAVPSLRRQAGSLRRGQAFRRVLLTGSGDSLIASLALQELFASAGIDAVAVPSLDASRYVHHQPEDLVVVVSVSGEVVRTIEAARCAHAAGATTVAVTANGSSTLASTCDDALVFPEPLDRSIPHSRDYTLTLAAIGVLAEALADTSFAELDEIHALVAVLIERSFREVERLGTHAAPETEGRTWFLGAGPDRATAMFGALKYWEAAAMASWWDDLEEFGHGSQLMARPGDRAVLIAAGLGARRAIEMVPGLRAMGMEVVVVGDDAMRLPRPADVPVLPTAPVPATWHPFVSCVPLQVMTYLRATALQLDVSVPWFGRTYGPTYDAVHTEWTKRGEILTERTES